MIIVHLNSNNLRAPANSEKEDAYPSDRSGKMTATKGKSR